MRERVTVVTLSVCQSVSLFNSGEGAVFRVETYISIILGDYLSPLNVALFWKASGTSAVTAAMYAGTAQTLNGLARDLLASEPFTKTVFCVVRALVSSLHLVAGLQTAFLSSK